jgi:Tfp pilus assembly protein PilF
MNIKTFIIAGAVVVLAGCSQAETDLTKAISLSRDGLSLLDKSKAKETSKEESKKLAKEGNEKIAASKEIYLGLISESPENGLYLNNYGWIQMKTGDLNGAKDSFAKAEKFRDTITPKGALDDNMEELSKLLSKKSD